MQKLQAQDQRMFQVIRFHQQEILLKHNQTHLVYRYEEANSQTTFVNATQHPLIMPTLELGAGFIYEKEQTSLERELAARINRSYRDYFDELEIMNTFRPIIEFLSKGNFYGNLSPKAILIDNEGAIKLKDPRLLSNINQISDNDTQALGLIVLQVSLLKEQKQAKQLFLNKSRLMVELQKLSFSTQFIAGVLILVNKIHELVGIVFHEDAAKNQHFRIIMKEIQEFKANKKKQNSSKVTNDTTIMLNTSSFPKKPKFNFQLQITPKKVVCVPPLNLNVKNSKNQQNIRTLQLSTKKRVTHNENLNEQMKSVHKTQNMNKILNGKNMTNQMKSKKTQYSNNSPMKRRGKTVDKKI